MRWRQGHGKPKTRPGAAYNLKTHSAFKLLTMATGYKVLCWYHSERKARRDRRGRRRNERDSKVWFIWEKIADGTMRRRADRGQILDGEYDKKKEWKNYTGVFRCRHPGAFACVALLFEKCLHVAWSLLFLPFSRVSSPRFDRKWWSRDNREMKSNETVFV